MHLDSRHWAGDPIVSSLGMFFRFRFCCTSRAVVLLVSLHFQPDQWTGYSMGCSWHEQSSSLLQTVEICGLQTVCHCLSGLFLGCHGLWKDIASSQWLIMMRSWWDCLKPSWVWVYNHQVLVVVPVKYILHSQLPKERKGLGLLLEVGFGSVAEKALSCRMFDQKTTLLASSLVQSAPVCPLCRMLMYYCWLNVFVPTCAEVCFNCILVLCFVMGLCSNLEK